MLWHVTTAHSNYLLVKIVHIHALLEASAPWLRNGTSLASGRKTEAAIPIRLYLHLVTVTGRESKYVMSSDLWNIPK